jgi:HSP20 family molecular chaperone IbpA
MAAFEHGVAGDEPAGGGNAAVVRPSWDERPAAVFHRTFTIGEAIDTEMISAELKTGVVTVHLPKSEKVKPRRIEVKCC